MPVLEAVLKSGWRGLVTCETFDAEAMQGLGERTPAELTSVAYSIIKDKMLSAF